MEKCIMNGNIYDNEYDGGMKYNVKLVSELDIDTKRFHNNNEILDLSLEFRSLNGLQFVPIIAKEINYLGRGYSLSDRLSNVYSFVNNVANQGYFHTYNVDNVVKSVTQYLIDAN